MTTVSIAAWLVQFANIAGGISTIVFPAALCFCFCYPSWSIETEVG